MAELGIDCTGEWTPNQYAIDSGWDWTCIQATAERGVSSTDAETLTEDQAARLLAWCKHRVREG